MLHPLRPLRPLHPLRPLQLQHEFVGALLRLAMLRHKARAKKTKGTASAALPSRPAQRCSLPEGSTSEPQTEEGRASSEGATQENGADRNGMEDAAEETSPGAASVIGPAFKLMVQEQITPRMVTVDASDPITIALKGRGCKAVRRAVLWPLS